LSRKYGRTRIKKAEPGQLRVSEQTTNKKGALHK
jgi:hypothetical protein